MRNIILLLGVFLTALSGISPAQAQTKITKEQANNYYFNCKSKPDPRMRPESQDAMCACTAAVLGESMTVEDIKIMSGDTLESRRALNKMLVEVYAPCMGFPVQDLVGMQCLDDPKIDKIGSNIPKEELCSCIAEKTASWFTLEGRALMRSVLLKTPNIVDPVGPIMETSTFKSQTYNSLIACLTEVQ